MALKNIIGQKTTTTGAIGVGATISLDGAALSAHNTFADGGAVSGTIYSVGIKDGDARQVGRVTYTSGTPGTLTIDSILDSTNGGSAITLTGDAEVYVDALAEDLAGDGGLITATAYTSSASGVSVPAGAKTLKATVVAGGGGGGDDDGTDKGGGGGGGGHAIAWRDVSGSSSVDVTVGAGGSPGFSTDGSDGGTSSVVDGATTVASASGGKGGGYPPGGGSPGVGGQGGNGTTGDVTGKGGVGFDGDDDRWGGSTIFAGLGVQAGPGGGGRGSFSGGGVSGEDGIVILEWFS